MLKKLAVILLLPVLIIVLGYLIVDSISKPVRFNQEKKRREAVAIERLKDIRTLQQAYKTKYGEYLKYIAEYDLAL